MILFRSIGLDEFSRLFDEQTIHGKFDCSQEKNNSSNCKNVICCFSKKFYWKDKRHKFLLELDIDRDEIKSYGQGTYAISEQCKKSRIWTGRTGKERICLDEVYIKHYSIQNVKKIYLGYYFANWYLETLKPQLDKFHIETIHPIDLNDYLFDKLK